MQSIEEKALKNYQDNMSYFQKKHPTLYNKLLALETILGDGSYKQNYDLQYNDGYFDVIELSTNTPLYNTNSQKFSQELTDKITYKKDDQTFKSYRKVTFGEKTRELIKTQNAYTQFSTTAQISDYYYEHTDHSMSMKTIEKFIFLGVGLGLHIEQTIKKFNLQVVLIVEDNVELFRLSMFTINYKDILNRSEAYFSIAENRTEFHTTFNNYFTKAFFKNQYIKFTIFSSLYEEKIQEIRSLLITRPEATYTHERLLVKNKRVIDKVNKKYKFLNLTKKDNETFFSDKPWLVIGAGPSLYNNTEWLVKNQDKFVIITAFTSLNTLKRVGVKPDIAVQIDENDFTTDEMLKKLDDLSFLDDTLIFFTASVSKLLFDAFEQENIYLHEDRTKYKLASSTLAVASVGETIYTLALLYNVENIYLLGIDLALGDDGKTHTPDHFKATTLTNKPDDKDEENKDFQLSNTTIDVKGNFRDIVQTTPLFALSIPVINYKTKNHRSQNQTIYNLSDGAYFSDMIPLKTSQLNLDKTIDKTKLSKELKEFFDGYCTKELDEKERDALKCREAQIQDYYKVLETFKNSPHANPDIFMASYIKFVSDMCNHKCTFELNELITIYFLKVASYVDDFLNTKEIKNSKKHIKKFKSFFVTQVEKILLAYEEDLKKLQKD